MLSTPLKTQAFLRNLPLFRELAEEEIERVAAGTRELRVKRGDILFSIINILPVLKLVEASDLKALAVTGKSEIPALAKVPTLQSQGISGFEQGRRVGIFAPKAPPPRSPRN